MNRLLQAIDRHVRPALPAERLSALRMLVGAFAVVYLLARVVNLTGFGSFNPAGFRPIGVITALGTTPLSGSVVILQYVACVLSGIAFLTGWRYRIFGPLFAALLLWVLTYRNSWGMIFHTENLMVLHVMVLGLSRAADVGSLDARAGRSAPARDLRRYGWAIRLMAWIAVVAYMLAGIAKLRLIGADWMTGDILRNYIADDNLRKLELGDFYSPIGAWLVGHGWVFPPLAFFTVIVELAGPVAFLGPWFARVWALLAWGFHVGVLAVMAIFFPYPLFGFAYAPLFAVERLPVLRRLTGLQPAPSDS